MPRKADLDWTSPPLDWVPAFWNRLMNPAWARMLGLLDRQNSSCPRGFPDRHPLRLAMDEPRKRKPCDESGQAAERTTAYRSADRRLESQLQARPGFRGKGRKREAARRNADLENALDQRLVARQLRRSLLDYMASSKFEPKTTITPENFREVFFDTRVMKKLAAGVLTAGADLKSRIPSVRWRSKFVSGQSVPLATRQQNGATSRSAFRKTRYLYGPRHHAATESSRTRGRYPRIRDRDKRRRHDMAGNKTRHIALDLRPAADRFGQTITTKFLRFSSLSGFGTDKVSALAELAVIYTGPPLPVDNSDYRIYTEHLGLARY